MSKKKLAKALVNAIMKTFEDMVFIDVSTSKEESVSIKYSKVLYISYLKPEAGEITLFLTPGCVRMITENIFSKEWENVENNDICDCLLELLNVLAGNFLRLFYEQSMQHDTTFPKLVADLSEIKKIEKYNTFFFKAEGIPFKVCLNICNKEVLYG